MTQTFPYDRWQACVRAALAALVLTTIACDDNTPLTQPDDVSDGSIPVGSETPSFAIEYAGGIPFGLTTLPARQFGSIYNGALRNARILVETGTFQTELAAIKSRGGKVFLQLTGNHIYYLDSEGHFSMTKWKNRVNTFKSINFSSYINDGTIIGHFLVDEPNDASNWGGRAIPPATVEEMAKYSKQIWPGMATVTRAESSYLAGWSGTYKYLDAAWAQWVARKGDPRTFVSRNIADAQKKGLALVVGLNFAKGYYGSRLSASLIKSAGSALLSTSYPCGFVSWQYEGEARYLATDSVKSAMKYLRAKAQNRPFKTCR